MQQMKIKSALIRKYRTEKFYSQEQLAQVSGLSLRTIQRLESQGQASIETVKSLAAVFNVPSEGLVLPDCGYQTYSHKQWGIFILALFGIAAIVLFALNIEFQDLPAPFFI